jgi:hypothetical protein
VPPALPQDQLLQLAEEHLVRGGTLYLQGDYQGAIRENEAFLCLLPSGTDVLYNIGQSYERLLQFERAIAYYERYAASLDPAVAAAAAERAGVLARVEVLRALPARVQVTTSPPGATVTLVDDAGVRRNLGRAGAEPLQVTAGRYAMTLELPGHEPRTETLDARIGQPYSFFVPLQPLRGRLVVTAEPGDARIFVDDRLVGVGRYADELPGGSYEVVVEAAGRPTERRTVAVAARRDTAVEVRLEPPPSTGRRWLLVGALVGGGAVGAVGLGVLGEDSSLGAGIGSAVGLVGGWLAIPSDIRTARANYILTTSAIAAVEAGLVASLVQQDSSQAEDVVGVMTTAGLAAGAAFAAFTASRFDLDVGDAALLNSGALWGGVAGGLFAVVFESQPRVSDVLVLGGLNLGVVTGVLLGRRATVSRRHVALVDLAGLAGMALSVAVKAAVDDALDVAPDADGGESNAHFALAGLALGLGAGAYFTRDLDAPRLGRFIPSVGASRDAAGALAPVLGVGGRW